MNAVQAGTAPAVRERHLALAEVREFRAQLARGLDRFGLLHYPKARRLIGRLNGIELVLRSLN